MEHRYKIDLTNYKKTSFILTDASEGALVDGFGPRRMDAKEPPPEPSLLLLPNPIIGFNIQNKK